MVLHVHFYGLPTQSPVYKIVPTFEGEMVVQEARAKLRQSPAFKSQQCQRQTQIQIITNLLMSRNLLGTTKD